MTSSHRKVPIILSDVAIAVFIMVSASVVAAESTPLESPTGISANQTLSGAENLKIGETFDLVVTVSHSSKQKPQIKERPKNKTWEVNEVRRSTKTTGERSTETKLKINTQVFRTGTMEVPAFTVLIREPGKDTLKFKTKPFTVSPNPIVSVDKAGKNFEFIDLDRPFSIYVRDYTLVGILGGLTVLLAGLFIVLAWKRGDETSKETIEVKPPAEHALERLKALTERTPETNEQLREFYLELSAVIRQYLERRYGIPAMEKTPYEMRGDLKKIEWPDKMPRVEVERWLKQCDFAKFSDQTPTKEGADSALETAFDIVESTKPVTASEESGDSGDDDGTRNEHSTPNIDKTA